MRTDVKVGLICAFLLLLGVVAYFAYSNGKTDKLKNGEVPINTVPPITSDNSPPPTGPGILITPPGTTSAPALLSGVPSFTSTAPSIVTTAPATAPTIVVVPPTTVPTLGGYPRTPTYGGTPLIVETPTHIDHTPSTGPGLILDTPVTPTHTSAAETYTVKKGDQLNAIAKAHHTTVKDIVKANPGLNPDKISVNQKIKIPAATATATTRPSSATTRPSHSSLSATTRPASTRPAATSSPKPGSSYTVKKGDTFAKIAKAAYGNEKLCGAKSGANRSEVGSPEDLEAGMKLRIPAK